MVGVTKHEFNPNFFYHFGVERLDCSIGSYGNKSWGVDHSMWRMYFSYARSRFFGGVDNFKIKVGKGGAHLALLVRSFVAGVIKVMVNAFMKKLNKKMEGRSFKMPDKAP